MDVDSLKVIKYKTNFITVLPIRLIVERVPKIMKDIYSGSGCISRYKVSMDSDSTVTVCLVSSHLVSLLLLLVPKLKQCLFVWFCL